MEKTIRVAIPTDDGLTVRQKFRGRAFSVTTIRSGMIVGQELRWNLLSEILTSGQGFYYNLADCNVVLVKEIPESSCDYLKSLKKKILSTDETEVSKALIRYIECEVSQVDEKLIA
jgi:predicted Fe-Mo cluster-binding NifX family protein